MFSASLSKATACQKLNCLKIFSNWLYRTGQQVAKLESQTDATPTMSQTRTPSNPLRWKQNIYCTHREMQMPHRNQMHIIHHLQPHVLGHHGNKNNLLPNSKSPPAASTVAPAHIIRTLQSQIITRMAHNLATSTEYDSATLYTG